MYKQEIWKNVLSSLETELSKATIATFFAGTELSSLENGMAKILCPNHLSADYLRNHYSQKLKETLQTLTSQPCTTAFEVRQIVSRPQELGPIFRTKSHDGLFSSYNFKNFVVGLSNQLAVSVAQAVVERPGELHNPFFLYSGVGLGKTHLLHAVGNAIKTANQEARILYCPAERFTNELIQAIQSGRSTAIFRRKFRSVDILLVDDVQFLAGREASQEEFFNTFNELYLAGSQVVLASDRNPSEISKLEARLVSRFSGGMVIDIQQPDLDLRLAILRQKAAEEGAALQDEVLLSLAEQISGNIRQLEGALHQLLTFLSSQKISPSKEAVKSIFKDFSPPKPCVTPEDIICAVSRLFGIDLGVLRSAKRSKDIVLPRQIAAYLLRSLGDLSLKKIGEVLGGRDHTTIIYALEKIERELTQNPILRNQVEAARGEILGKTS